MTWVEEELAPPGRLNWRIGVLDHDLTNGDLNITVEELVRWYIEDCQWALAEMAAYRAAFADLAQLARDANATLAAVKTVARKIASEQPR